MDHPRGQGRGQGRGRGSRGQPRGRGGPPGQERGGRGASPSRGGSPSTRTDSPAISESTSASSSFVPRGRGEFRGRGAPPGASGFEPRGRGGPPGGAPRGAGGSGFGRGRGGPVQVFAPNQPVQPDSRLSSKEQDALVARFRNLSTSVPDRVVRPGFGKRGQALTLRANFFAIKYPKNVILYDYAIKISPSVKSEERRLRKRLFDLLESSAEFAPFLHDIAHDRAQRLISRRLLPNNLSVSVPFYEEGQAGPRADGKTYVVEFLEPKELKSSELGRHLQGDDVDYDPLPIISAFNLVTSAHAARTGIPFGKNRYFFPPDSFAPPESAFPLSSGLEAWKGFFSSVRPVYKQLMVNVNICMSAFYVPYSRLSEAMIEFQRQSRGATLQAFYERVRVTTTHLGYRKRSSIKGFGNKTARQQKFQCDELGGMVSVEQYFKRVHNKTLQHADDLLVVNIGNKNRDIFVPAELCEIEPGQTYAGRLSERETAEMIKYACNPPFVNAQMITGQGLGMLGLQQRASPMVGFGVEVSIEMAVVPARILTPPKVIYRSGEPRVADGSWNILGVRFHRGAGLTKFAILILPDNDREDFRGGDDPALREVVQGFLQKCRSSGMQVDSQIPPLLVAPLPRQTPQDPLRTAAIDLIEQRIKSLPGKPNMILVFMSRRDLNIYPGLKKLCDTKLGIPTVCMLTPKVRRERGQDQYFSNVALKVNAKLGGVNHQIDAGAMSWLKNTMLVGMDVTHPGAGCVTGTPSIAAVVASCDNEFMQYPASVMMHEPREEMIKTNVKQMMIERLQEYQRRMGSLPARIVVFRDGVSEGQFDLVLIHELPEIKASFRAFPSYTPKLTIAICGKRHHARFYPTRPEQADKTSNTKAGTIVDQGVTAVYDFDYYLQAHAGLQGTVRATHYTVVFDENKFPADVIQQGTNDVSYLWARATKSVSLVPPAYWADRACERARLYLHGILPPLEGSREKKMNEEQIARRARELWGAGVHDDLKSTMFYL